MNHWASLLRCKVGSWPIQYLGAKIGDSPKKCQFWEPLVKKFHSLMNKWKDSGISMAGRLVILKAVLDSMPIYWMNLYKIPTSVINIIEKIRRNFLWKGKNSSTRKLHLINWARICKNKKFGGLGVASIKNRNAALLSKWWWRYRFEDRSLWIRIIEGKYGTLEKCNTGQRTPSLSPIMQTMLSAKEFTEFKLFESDNFKWEVGKGTRITFWEDHWHRDQILKERFPRLYDLCILKESSIKDMMVSLNQYKSGSTSVWRRNLRSWEIEEEKLIEEIIKEANLGSSNDIVKWKVNSDKYNTTQGYKLLSEGDNEVNVQWEWIWKSKIPPKIKLFLWKIAHKIIPTKSFLAHRGLNIKTKCSWCDLEVEDLDHML